MTLLRKAPMMDNAVRLWGYSGLTAREAIDAVDLIWASAG
jgi:hypothetical protein